MAASAPDGFAKAEYLKALDEVHVERIARQLDRARVKFVEVHGRDIERVEELVEVEPAILRRLPPEPHGWEWVLDDDRRIVSSYIGYRYEVKIDAMNQQLLEQFRERSRNTANENENEDEGREG